MSLFPEYEDVICGNCGGEGVHASGKGCGRCGGTRTEVRSFSTEERLERLEHFVEYLAEKLGEA